MATNLRFSSPLATEIDQLLLLSLLTTGEITSSLLADAFKASGFNQTQARICLLLLNETQEIGAGFAGLTLKEMSQALVCAPSKLHPQLLQLLDQKILRKSESQPDATDKRQRFYGLTASGMARAKVLFRRVAGVNSTFVRMASDKKVKYFDGFVKINAHIEDLWSSDAFEIDAS